MSIRLPENSPSKYFESEKIVDCTDCKKEYYEISMYVINGMYREVSYLKKKKDEITIRSSAAE